MVPRIVLGRVYEAERRRQLPTQFRMTDIMWLILLVQLAMTPLGLIDRHDPVIPILYTLVLIASVLIWWHSLRVLSRAGVLEFWRRGLFLVVVVPLTLVLTVSGAVSVCMLPFAVFRLGLQMRLGEPLEWRNLVTVLLVMVVTVVLVWLMRKTANYVLSSVAVEKMRSTLNGVDPHVS